MATIAISPAPVRRSVKVNAAPPKAFRVFTSGMGKWWPKQHSLNSKSAQQDVIVEPHAGGRWYERSEDGSECEWGRVLTWEPPARVVLAWQINGNWQYDRDFETEVEVRFVQTAAAPASSSSIETSSASATRRTRSALPSILRKGGTAGCSCSPKRWRRNAVVTPLPISRSRH